MDRDGLEKIEFGAIKERLPCPYCGGIGERIKSTHDNPCHEGPYYSDDWMVSMATHYVREINQQFEHVIDRLDRTIRPVDEQKSIELEEQIRNLNGRVVRAFSPWTTLIPNVDESQEW